MFIIFDTETHGLPKSYSVSPEVSSNWPRIIELAWEVWEPELVSVETEGGFSLAGKYNLIKQKSELIKPEGWEITDPFALKRFSNKTNELFGIPIKEILPEFIKDRQACKYEIGHNLSFDRKIVRAEMIRAGLKEEFTTKKIDTMHGSRSFCNLYKSKPPKLEELYEILFKTKFENSHTAAADVAATSKCFFELLNRKIIKL